MRKLRAEFLEIEPEYKGKAVFYEENGDPYEANFKLEWDGTLAIGGNGERFDYLNERYTPQEVSGALKSAFQNDMAAGLLPRKDSGQLALEIYVSSLDRSIEFYTRLGFTLKRRESKFALLMWMDCILMLDEREGAKGGGNVRILIEDVDYYWGRVQELDLKVLAEIGDRYYGLRDFTIADPDGFGIRFASVLA